MNEQTSTSAATLDIKDVLAELEVPFAPEQIQWRITNTSNDKKRGQVVAYADPRAYTDRLNALFTPQGWTREYKVETMSNITRVKKGESIVTGKVLVTCTVTIIGLWSHSGTGEEWADDENGMTSADAQAFKRACSCFGLGRYLYDFHAPWVDLDQNRQPKRAPALPAWAIPENWRKGMRPLGRNGNGSDTAPANGTNGHNGSAKPNGSGNGKVVADAQNGAARTASDDLDARILSMEKTIGFGLYRNILREYGRVNQPKLIRDAATKQKVLRVLESASRGFKRLDSVKNSIDPETLPALLEKLQAPPLDEIADMKTLQQVVFGLEELAGTSPRPA